MNSNLEKVLFYLIFACTGIILFSALLTDSSFFFPFVFTKVLIFRLAVEAMVVFYLLLIYLNKEYLPRLNLVSLSLIAYVVLVFILSAIGNDFYLSFWGDIERSEGLMLWLHMLPFFIILGSVFKKKKHWIQLMDFSIVVALLTALFALGQVFQLESILNTTGNRVASTIGNPAFFALYLIFSIGIAAYLFVKRENIFAKSYYATLIVFFSYIILKTETRGAALGLAAGVLISAFLWLLNSKNRKIKYASAGILIFIALLGAVTFFAKDSYFVQNNSSLNRIATISIQERTAQTRLATWGAAWEGFKDKPWGYGQESFTYVFDKNFPALIYEDEGSRVWFDRAHNLIFDKLITGGFIGLAIFLFFIFYPIYYIYRKARQGEYDKNVAIVFVGLVSAYFVQAMFVFETISTYILLMFIWAFLSMQVPEINFKRRLLENKKVRLALFVLALIAVIPIAYVVNIKPAKINIAAATAMNLDRQTYSFFDAVDQYKQVLESNTYGVPEYSIIFIEFIDSQLVNVGAILEEVKPVLEYTDNHLEKMIEFKPLNAKIYLLAMRHYNYTFASIPDEKFERLDKALTFFPLLQDLSFNRPNIYQEAGYSNIYKFRNYKDEEIDEEAKLAFNQAEEYFQQTIDINPQVVESYINLIMLYLNAEDAKKVFEVIGVMEENSINFRHMRYLDRFSQLAVSNLNYEAAIYFYEEIIKIEPENVSAWTDLALSYAYFGDVPKALELAEQIKEFADEITIQRADLFIEELKAGKYNPE